MARILFSRALRQVDRMNVEEFVNGEYFAHVEATLAPSTIEGYRKLWRSYGKYFDGRGLDIRVIDCQAILRQIAADNPHLNCTSLSHAKNFFSGVWTHSLRMGVLDRDNPWRVASMPKAPEPGETYAYSVAEVEAMLAALEPPLDLMSLFAACTGLRKSEIRGCIWSDFDPTTRTLSIERAVWKTAVKTTKNKASKAPIPITPPLAERLVKFRGKAPAGHFIFGGADPMDWDNTTRRKIIPTLRAAGVKWHGWHSFRRGLATMLHAAGVPDVEVQRVLRHADLATTAKCYIKSLPQNIRSAVDTIKFG
jgi:integrase